MIALSAWLVIRLQVAGIYFHAAIGKAAVQEWVDGTALYYWLLHPTLGAAHWLAPILQHLLLNPFIVALLTWGALLLEIALFTALVVSRRWWPILLALGLCFHGGIMVVQGLVSFSIAMMGALVLYLRPPGQVFPLPLGLSPVREATHARLSPTPEPFARAKSR
jgi:antimicrobial peptide system SdpB family protein